MGIHGFFSYFIKTVPGLVTGIKKSECVSVLKRFGKPIEIDVLAFELNPIFYDAERLIKSDLEEKNKVETSFLRSYSKKTPVTLTLEETTKKIYENVVRIVDEYVNCNKPKHSIYFVIDGVAGMSKQTQQRQRRYIDKTIETGEKFSKTRITPGTEFLYNFSKYFKIHIKNKMKNEWKHLNVYLNDAKVVGEGEHKLMYYIKTLPPNLSVSIISPDADLFMLSMGLRRTDIYIFRKVDDYMKKMVRNLDDKDLCLSDINVIKNYIIQEAGILPKIDENKTSEGTLSIDVIKQNITKSPLDMYKQNKDNVSELEEYKHKAIEDFILFMMLVGNDFVPHIPHLEINDKNASLLFDCYKEVVKEFGFITKRNEDNTDLSINPISFKQIFKKLSEGNKEYRRVLNDAMDSRLDNPFVLLDKNKELTEKGVVVNLENYKKDYYINKLKFGVTFDFEKSQETQIMSPLNEPKYYLEDKIDFKRYEEELKVMVDEFIKAMVFVVKYYLFKIPTYNWFYPYHYSPFLYEVWKYFPKDINYKFDYAPPLSPFEQLLCVLPPNKARLLPEPLRPLMTSPDSPISDMYPVKWKTDKDGSFNGELNDGRGKWKELLPFSDYYRVRENFDKLKDKLTDEEKERNAPGNIFKYTFSNNKVIESISNV